MNSSQDDNARRAYWAEQLQAGFDLVQKIIDFPVEENGEPFASIPDEAKRHGIQMLFSTSKIAGDLERVFYIRQGLVENLMAIGRDMNKRGWILKIEDGYRSLEMQGQLVRKPELFDAILKKCIWEYGGQIPPVELVFRRAIVLIANIPKIGTHMSGSAVDISVFRQSDDSEVWRGNHYLEMSERTPMRSPFVEPDSLQNRLEITDMMEAHGFVHFPFEFWHYNQGDALGNLLTGRTTPARYGPVHWNPQTNQVTACENACEPLNPLPVVEREIEAAMIRAQRSC